MIAIKIVRRMKNIKSIINRERRAIILLMYILFSSIFLNLPATLVNVSLFNFNKYFLNFIYVDPILNSWNYIIANGETKKPETHPAEIYELFEMNVWIIYALFLN